MKYSSRITPDNIYLFMEPDGKLWLCDHCNEILSPSELESQFGIKKKYPQGTHYCKGGKKGTLHKMSIKGYLSHYQFEEPMGENETEMVLAG